MKNKYIGITIGPIYDTMLLASTPAALWGSSFLFSYIAKRLCEKLIESGVEESDFILPFFQIKDKKLVLPDIENLKINDLVKSGIGLFPDRIIYKGSDLIKAQKIIDETKEEIALKFANDLTTDNSEYQEADIKEYFFQYLQIYAVCNDVNKNAILELSPFLDAYELQKSFVSIEKTNYILELFINKEQKSRNEKIKTSFLVADKENWQLTHTDSDNSLTDKTNYRIKDITYISGGSAKVKNMKKHYYYAIVQADGDYMGKVLESLNGDTDKIREFSKKCFTYGAISSQLINAFGGVTLYAGGDDLLFIAPVESVKSGQPKALLELLEEISCCFNKLFSNFTELDNEYKPALSFGVAIHYHKFPLYEALKNASYLLFDVAKSKRNSVAIKLQKHSGKSLEFIVKNFYSEQGLNQNIKDVMQLCSESIREEYLNSVAHKISQFDVLFSFADKMNILNAAFENTFDSSDHKLVSSAKYIEEIKELFKKLKDIEANVPERQSMTDNPKGTEMNELERQSKSEKSNDTEMNNSENQYINKEAEVSSKVYALLALLEFIKFYTEEGSETREA